MSSDNIFEATPTALLLLQMVLQSSSGCKLFNMSGRASCGYPSCFFPSHKAKHNNFQVTKQGETKGRYCAKCQVGLALVKAPSDVARLCSQDYASILEHLIQRWELEGLEGLSSEGQQAQEYVCKLPPRIRRLADRTLMRKEKGKKREVPFTWICDRTINM